MRFKPGIVQAALTENCIQPADRKPCVARASDAICAALGFDVTTLICTGNNHFRKPSYLLWEYFVANCNDGKAVDLSKVA